MPWRPWDHRVDLRGGAVAIGPEGYVYFSVGDHLTCYETPPSGANPKVNKQIVDPFVAQTVRPVEHRLEQLPGQGAGQHEGAGQAEQIPGGQEHQPPDDGVRRREGRQGRRDAERGKGGPEPVGVAQ